MRKNFILAASLLAIFLIVPLAHAQEPLAEFERTLTELERQLEAAPENEYLQKKIAATRTSIREKIDQELTAELAANEAAVNPSGEESAKAIERQQKTVAMLAERIQGLKVDLDLLNAEEEFYGPDGSDITTETVTSFRLTTSHPALLAKRAILEERIAALESLHTLAKERLGKLTRANIFEQYRFFITAAKYLLILVVIWFLERLIRIRFLSRIERLEVRYTVIKSFTAGVYILTGIWLVSQLLVSQPNILTSLAIVGAGLAIALQDIVKDVVGWFLIHQHRLFMHGHRVTIGAETGDVIDVGILRTKMLEVGMSGAVLERTGKVLSVPNAMVLVQDVVNHHATSDYVRAEMRVTVTYESDWKKAEKILKKILTEETNTYAEKELRQAFERTRTYYIPQHSRGPLVHMDLAADGIEFTLRFAVPIGERRPVVTKISRKILEAFTEDSGIGLAYKTVRSVSIPAKENV